MLVFEPPSSSRDVGYLLNGSGRIWKLQGRPTRCIAESVKPRIPSVILISRAAHSFFVTTGPFINQQKLSFHRQHPLSPSQWPPWHCTYAILSQLQAWVWTHCCHPACFHLACGFGGGADGNDNGHAQDHALPYQWLGYLLPWESQSIHKGNSCHTQRVYVRAIQVGGHSTLVNGGVVYALSQNPCRYCNKESRNNTSSWAFGDLTGIYLGVYNSLQVSLEPAGVGTKGFLFISTRRIWACEYQGKEVYEVQGARFKRATWTQLTT